jgi:hypothetical protein
MEKIPAVRCKAADLLPLRAPYGFVQVLGVPGMNMDDPHYQDCLRDVLAMLEQALGIHAAGGPGPEYAMAAENLVLLLDNADTADCLKIAVSMLATSWQMLCHVRAGERGTSPEQELADVFATFRDRLV